MACCWTCEYFILFNLFWLIAVVVESFGAAAAETILVEECTGDGMILSIDGPFIGDIQVNKQFACTFPIRLLKGERMTFQVPYGKQCNFNVDEDGKSVANLQLSEQQFATTRRTLTYKYLSCQYSLTKRVVKPSLVTKDAGEEKRPYNPETTTTSKKVLQHDFQLNNVESDKLHVDEALDKRVTLLAGANDRQNEIDVLPKSVYLNREREYARSVSVKSSPDPQLLERLHYQRRSTAAAPPPVTDDDGFMTVTQRFVVKTSPSPSR